MQAISKANNPPKQRPISLNMGGRRIGENEPPGRGGEFYAMSKDIWIALIVRLRQAYLSPSNALTSQVLSFAMKIAKAKLFY